MYCTPAQMIDMYGEADLIALTDRAGVGTLDTSVLERALEDAAAEIDMYLATRYQLPLSTQPRPLVRLAALLARDNLAPGIGQVDEQWKAQVEGARRTLREIAAGRISLGVDAQAQSAQESDGAQMVSGGRIWDRDDSQGYL